MVVVVVAVAGRADDGGVDVGRQGIGTRVAVSTLDCRAYGSPPRDSRGHRVGLETIDDCKCGCLGGARERGAACMNAVRWRLTFGMAAADTEPERALDSTRLDSPTSFFQHFGQFPAVCIQALQILVHYNSPPFSTAGPSRLLSSFASSLLYASQTR